MNEDRFLGLDSDGGLDTDEDDTLLWNTVKKLGFLNIYQNGGGGVCMLTSVQILIPDFRFLAEFYHVIHLTITITTESERKLIKMVIRRIFKLNCYLRGVELGESRSRGVRRMSNIKNKLF